MADENDVVAEEAAPPKRKPILLVAIILVGILMGGAAGVFVIVPMVVGKPAVAAAVEESAPVERPRRDGTPILSSIDNLVLNPLGSGGTRFLMVTVAFELRDTRTLEQMRVREAEIRDALLLTFGSKTVDELVDLEQRELLRQEILGTVEAVLQPGAVLKVYLPQFVIQ